MSNEIEYAVADNVAILRLNRVANRNAQSRRLLEALDRPVFVLVEGEARDRARELWGEPAAASDPLALHRLPL